MEEIRCLLWLVMIFGAGNPRIWKALHRYHSPQKAVEILRKPETDADLHLPEHTLRRIRQTGEDKVDEMLERCEKLRLSILWYGDAAYPEQLLSIVNPPVLLFYQGGQLPAAKSPAADYCGNSQSGGVQSAGGENHLS